MVFSYIHSMLVEALARGRLVASTTYPPRLTSTVSACQHAKMLELVGRTHKAKTKHIFQLCSPTERSQSIQLWPVSTAEIKSRGRMLSA